MIFSVKTKLFVMIAVVIVGGCATTHGSNQAERRQAVQNMKNEALAELYKAHPMARAEIAGAPGYAAFSNANVKLIFASFGGGYGVVTDNKSGKVTYMKMGEVGVGLGLGIKDFRAIFVFHDKYSLDRFVNSGWAFGGDADAAAKAGDKGAAVGGGVLVDGITVYQFTQSGLALQAMVKGTKYWKDDELN